MEVTEESLAIIRGAFPDALLCVELGDKYIFPEEDGSIVAETLEVNRRTFSSVEIVKVIEALMYQGYRIVMVQQV